MTTNVIVIPEGKICDYIDGKFRNDTPEEHVRQTIEKRLVNEHNYGKDRIQVEYTLRLGSNKPRADIVIFGEAAVDHSQENIHIIVECKKESVDPTHKKDGIGQLQSYMSACVNCEWGLWTNGKSKLVFRKVINETGKIEFQEYNDIPSADGSVDAVDRPKRETLKNAVENNLLFVFRACHNHIYITDGMQKQPAFFELLKVIFCKIEDEKNFPHSLEFYATSSERANPDGQLTVKNRLGKIFERVKKKYGKIFDKDDSIKLLPRSLAYVVSELQKYSLLNTDIDIKGKAYEELVGANLRGDRGEFFTPRNVMEMTVRMLRPTMKDKVLDPSCGTGGFLVIAMKEIIKNLEHQLTEASGKTMRNWNYDELRFYQDRISEIASSNFFGFDINPDLVKATKMNMVMNNDGSGNILQTDSLLLPHEWSEEFRAKLAEALGVSKSELRNPTSISHFDLIITNPPFGSKIPIKDPHILEQYDLGHIWERDGDGWRVTTRLQSSVPPEQLFIERCLQFLKPNGRMGIVLPDSILGSPGLGYIRHWLLQHTRIVASIDLHVDTFQPRNGTQTSVLILQKKTEDELNEIQTKRIMRDYNIFMAMVDKIGHDKRGNPIFRRDRYGNEILVPENRDLTVVDAIASGERTVQRVESKTKIKDDQTPDVVEVFGQWKRGEGIPW